MKTFNELTTSQQEEAVESALSELRDLIDQGFIEFEGQIAPSDEKIKEFAESWAEESVYNDDGKLVERFLSEEEAV